MPGWSLNHPGEEIIVEYMVVGAVIVGGLVVIILAWRNGTSQSCCGYEVPALDVSGTSYPSEEIAIGAAGRHIDLCTEVDFDDG